MIDPGPRTALLGTALATLLAGACERSTTATPADPEPAPAVQRQDPGLPYDELRRQYPTTLTRRGPSTGSQEPPQAPADVEVVAVQSGELSLLAWLAVPEGASSEAPVPGLVYFHGAFSLKPRDYAAVAFAREQGFAVLLPSLRGENGNPGHLELLAGEVDDAVAAIESLAARPEVDADRIYAIGHSVGGALAALVSLRPDARVRLTGSVGGIYVPETFVRWSKMSANRALVRFDPTDPIEGRLRSLLPNVADMVHPHLAYIGDDDSWFHDNAAAVSVAAEQAGVTLFSTHAVAGDHGTSLAPGLAAFIERAQRDAGAPTPAAVD